MLRPAYALPFYFNSKHVLMMTSLILQCTARYVIPLAVDNNLSSELRIVIRDRPLGVACDLIWVRFLCGRFYRIPHGIVGVITFFILQHLQHSVITFLSVTVNAVFRPYIG